MALEIQNLFEIKKKIENCDVSIFVDSGQSYSNFVKKIHITQFRHIVDLEVGFSSPVTAIAGSNRSGKTSLLLLLACSHEKFMRLDAKSTAVGMREHTWADVLSFTSHETVQSDYEYKMEWREGTKDRDGTGKRLHTSRAWSGLAKRSSDKNRTNAKIRKKEVRLIDLERLLPARAFSDYLFKKANGAQVLALDVDIAKAFGYIFSTPVASISEAANHLNRRCFIINRNTATYSTYNAASGEEAVIYILKDLIESPKNTLILIEEIEAGIHPAVLRKLIDIVYMVSWRDKKQVIFTTHSPTALSAVDGCSRRFIESNNGQWKCTPEISIQAAASKMDSISHPLIQLYCEDDLAQFLISQQLIDLSNTEPHISRLINIVPSGPINEVKVDYERHKKNFSHLRNKIGYCAVMDGDYAEDENYAYYMNNNDEYAGFIYPHDKPEKFLVRSYLSSHPNEELSSSLQYEDHHFLFEKMINLGLASDKKDARNRCYDVFKLSAEYQRHSDDIKQLVTRSLQHFSVIRD
ncbi:AAA family ATPase [Comamonas testosteroni]|uniref:AAA family ATPase n=1 Tax=Comamonas testosteroni TaxID=285 RepID=UPI0015FC0F82|nr:AAA family ATPase [Comamonas testosteroni]WEE75713.1 AAA family ATPase [Comamonas testosteroni]